MTILAKQNNQKEVEYFKQHQLPAVFECLVAGLITICPKDPLKWLVEEGFQKIEEKGVANITWDMFIPEDTKSRVQSVTESYLDDILMLGSSTQPTVEMMTAAYNFYWTSLKRKCFKSIVKYCKLSKIKRRKLELQIYECQIHDDKRIIRKYFRKWRRYNSTVKDLMTKTCKRIERACMKNLMRVMLKSWLKVASEERRTREYFEKIERGEDIDLDSDTSSVDSSDKISKLPNKIIMRMFSHLDIMDLGRCAMVCRSWRVLAGSSTLWSNLNIYRVRYSIKDSTVFQFLIKYRAYIIHLNLRQCSQVTARTLRAITECRNLQDLNLSENPNVNDHVMRFITESCLGLLYLNISHCPIGNATLRALARYSENLQHLNIAYCGRCTNRGLQYFSFAKGCSKLVHLDLTGCDKFSADGFLYIAKCCSGLESLVLNEIANVNDVTMGHFSQCLNLKFLSMIGPTMVTDAGYKCMAVNQKLRKLRIESNRRITDYTFKFLSKCCVLLNHLYAVDCHLLSDSGLRRLALLRHLVVVNLADSVRISDLGVRHLLDGHSAAKIREINFSNCYKISDVSMLRISQKCQSLTHLTLCFCDHISDAGIELLNTLPVLSDVDLSGTNISDHGMETLGELRSLRSLIVSECSRITDIGIDKFSAHAKLLEGIDVSHCMELTDQAIKHLAFCCRYLADVSMAGCPQMSDLSIQYLASVCCYLHVLNLSGCIRITDKGLQFLERKCPRLQYLSLLYCRNVSRNSAKIAAITVENVEYNDDPVPSWFNYSDFLALDEEKRV